MDRVGDEQPPRMSDDEKRLARKWWHEGKTQTEIASLLSRHRSSISRAVVTSAEKKAQGRPRELSSDAVDKVAAMLEKMVDDAERPARAAGKARRSGAGPVEGIY